MKNIRQKIKKFVKKTGYGIAALLIVANVFALINERSLIQVSPREAEASAESSTTFSIRCKTTNTVNAQSNFAIVSLFGEDGESASITISALDSGKTITQSAVKKDIYAFDGRKHSVAIFDGPQIKHLAACIGRKVESGSLSISQLRSAENNPPILIASGNTTNVSNFKRIHNNGNQVSVINGARSSGTSVTNIKYGKGTENPYRIAVTNPYDKNEGLQSYRYSIAMNSVLE